MIIVSPQSQASSWDVIRDGYGPDVQTMDQALHALFAKYTIDASRCSIGGFSDGASYALSLGVTNGDLFNKIIAFSPGFMRPGKPVSAAVCRKRCQYLQKPFLVCAACSHVQRCQSITFRKYCSRIAVLVQFGTRPLCCTLVLGRQCAVLHVQTLL